MREKIYRYRHFFSVVITLCVTWIIVIITKGLYFYPGVELNIIEMFILLWGTNKTYFQVIAIMNFVVKPLFVYYLVIVCIEEYCR